MRATVWIGVSLAAFALAGSAWGADAAAGKDKAKSCAGCHGANGEGKAKYPAIAGMDEKAFVQDLQDYKSGKKNNGMMKGATKNLSDADMENLAAYFHSLKK